MKKILRVLVSLLAILFVMLGLRWVTDPSAAALTSGMQLLEGVGRSTQIADVGALFLSLGLMILIALISGSRAWFQAPALMLLLAASLRILAWLVHDAALPLEMIGVEVVGASLLLLASFRLQRGG
ncbi:MAG: hypothetical protein H6985_17260 [Pseudomonadales bacterium]|nr:hypothetical protein [Halioglobus sp.]MCP5131319.1 hypothetical protein [Pseudomonadales bacterium]